MKTLFSTRCQLKPLHRNDFGEMLDMYHEKDTHKYIPQLLNQTDDWYLNRFEQHLIYNQNNNGLGLWTVRDLYSKKYLGTLNLNVYDPMQLTHIGAHFKRTCWGKGLATETLMILRDYGFEILKLPKIHGIVSKPHIASQTMLKNIGMQFERAIIIGDEKDVQLYAVTPEMLSDSV